MSSTAHMRWRRRTCAAMVWAALLASAGCGPQPVTRLGFLGGLSNQASSFSEEGRNGAILAIEQRNQAGGIAGRRIALEVQDYDETPGGAGAAFDALRAAGVAAVIGPFSSAVAAGLDPVVDQARLLVLSPISRRSATDRPQGYLVRFGRVRRHEAQAVAGMLQARGVRRVALASDMRNAAYSTSWVADFREAFMTQGGEAVVDVGFARDAELSYAGVADKLLASRPDAVVFVSSGVDAARLAQQVGKRAPALPMTASGRAINVALLELGGQAVEGMVVVQPYDANDASPRFRAFHRAYAERFGQAPTYSAMVCFDAVNVLAEALGRRGAQESPREALIRLGPYQGLQEAIRFDGVGTPARRPYFSVVRNGRFEPMP